MNKSNDPTDPASGAYAHEEQRPNVLHRIGAFFALRDEDDEPDELVTDPPKRNVVSFSSSRDSARRPGSEVSLFAPRAFADVTEVADALRGRQVVIVNLQGIDRNLLQRVVD
ncbi:MAG: cell division protein SepF, partial [Vulcanimicrobiaceae bacterium]